MSHRFGALGWVTSLVSEPWRPIRVQHIQVVGPVFRMAVGVAVRCLFRRIHKPRHKAAKPVGKWVVDIATRSRPSSG